MKRDHQPPAWLFTLVRILIGWHFLYEGLVKLFNPNWTAAPFLMESTWIFSGFFKALASNPGILGIINFLNVWGLILIGFGLILGVFIRAAAWSGAGLLMLYYLAQPPFTGFMINGSEGNYIWINKNLIELAVLVLFAFLPKEWSFGINNIVNIREYIRRKTKPTTTRVIKVPETDNPKFAELPALDRRRVLKNLISIPVLGGFSYAVLKNFGYESYEEKDLKTNGITSASVKIRNFAGLKDLKERPPLGKIGNLEVSRLICGGNLIAGFAHSRDLIYVSGLLKAYFSDEKIWETFRLCEACGINSAIVRTAADTVKVVNKYWKLGGKIQWLAQTYPADNDVVSNTQWAVDSGAAAVYIQGNIADRWINAGRIDLFEKWFSQFAAKGIPVGVGAHELAVVQIMEEKGFPVDFYMKTLHPQNYWSFQPDEPKDRVIVNNRDNYWCRTPEETALYMENISKPWIAYKVLAAGAIKPEEGFRYAFENGADFICVGMFDYQVVDDCNFLHSALNNIENRKRRFFS